MDPKLQEERIALLGTGIMGSGIARTLLNSDVPLRVWNRTESKARDLGRFGAEVSASPVEATADATVVITTLENAEIVEQVMLDEGALAATNPRARWLQMGTIGPLATERLAESTQRLGRHFLDAPMVGAGEAAASGTLTVLVGGSDSVIKSVDPILSIIANRIVHTGDAGTSSRLKLVVNTWLLILFSGLAESFALAEASGLDPDLLLRAIEGTGMDSPYAHEKGMRLTEAERHETNFSVRLAVKDALLAQDWGLRNQQSLPVLRAVSVQLESAVAKGLGDDDYLSSYAAWRS